MGIDVHNRGEHPHGKNHLWTDINGLYECLPCGTWADRIRHRRFNLWPRTGLLFALEPALVKAQCTADVLVIILLDLGNDKAGGDIEVMNEEAAEAVDDFLSSEKGQ